MATTLLVKSSYAGHSLYTLANVGLCALSAKTVLFGTEGAIRRMLDKLRDHAVTRDLDPLLSETIASGIHEKAAVAAAVSFGGHPLGVDLPFLGWLKSVTAARVLAHLADPGLTVDGTISCADDAGAAKVVTAVQQLSALATFSSYARPLSKLQNLEVKTAGHDAKLSFAVDDRQLRGLLVQLVGTRAAATAP
jgi:hypothetical protein